MEQTPPPPPPPPPPFPIPGIDFFHFSLSSLCHPPAHAPDSESARAATVALQCKMADG
jgi:hypothetical protein